MAAVWRWIVRMVARKQRIKEQTKEEYIRFLATEILDALDQGADIDE